MEGEASGPCCKEHPAGGVGVVRKGYLGMGTLELSDVRTIDSTQRVRNGTAVRRNSMSEGTEA